MSAHDPKRGFRRIAVLNRGEAAVRFIRAVREYNLVRGTDLQAIALYTEPDARAPFVRMAHEAWDLGSVMRQDTTTGETKNAYCDYHHVLRTLRMAKCDALWPGWGFLAEDPVFVSLLEEEGIVFIGPSSKAMKALGDKIEAKRFATRCDVPLAPWYEVGTEDSPSQILEQGDRIGYPLMVKASAGGGGRGIQKVDRREDLVEAISTVDQQVRQFFGQGGIMMEACVTQARHIEVQLVVGADGVARALGVRDCSIQRRHQKLLEETPSSVVSEEISQDLCRASERLAEAVGYRGVGTAEYLVNPTTGQCCFLEVNSRLQVEHTVTEMVTGLDLVQAQIDIARGLEWLTGEIEHKGWAIEARVNAEDPERNFQPSPGHVRMFRIPSGPGIRVDSGVLDEMSIAPEFDSMIAKVIAWGPTRELAVARLVRALREFEVVVEDGATNRAFLVDLLGRDEFMDGSASTSWLDEEMARGALMVGQRQFEALVAAAILEYRRDRHRSVQRFFVETQNGRPQNIPEPEGEELSLRLRGRETRVVVHDLGQGEYSVELAGGLHRVRLDVTGTYSAALTVAHTQHTVLYAYGSTGISLEVDGTAHIVERSSGGVVRAPAPAMVVHVAVSEGDRVEAGDRLCTLEAMKLEMGVKAQKAGRVCSVLCRANQQVSAGQPIIILEPEEGGAEHEENTALEMPEESGASFWSLLGGDTPTPIALDSLSEDDATHVREGLQDTLRAFLLGYDVPTESIRRIEYLLHNDQPYALLAKPERWSWVGELLSQFVDIEALFDRNYVLDVNIAASMTADQAFFEFCRQHHEGEEGAPTEVRPLLSNALGHYRIADLEPSDELREALWRIARSHQAGGVKYQVVSSLLRAMIQLHYAGVRFDAELRNTIERVGTVVGHRAPFVGDNARQALYVLFEQSRYVRRSQELERMLDQAVQSLSLENSSALDDLARSTWSVLPVMIQRANEAQQNPSDGPTRASQAIARAILHRIYTGQTFSTVRDLSTTHALSIVASPEEAAPHVLVVSLQKDLDSALRELVQSLSKDSQGSAIETLDIVLCDSDYTALQLQDPLIAGELLTALKSLKRVSVLWRGTRRMHTRTYLPTRTDGATTWDVQTQLCDIHPHAAKRLEFDRLDAFALDSLEAPDGIHAFCARARSNPRDERIIILGEVGQENPSEVNTAVGQKLFGEFAQVYFEALRVLRDAQLRRPPRRRFQGNVMSLFIRPIVPLNVTSIVRFVKRLGDPPQRLGLERVVLRVHVPDLSVKSGVRETEFVIRTLGRHRMEVEERAPERSVVRAMTPYETRCARARRVGCIFPYEILWMLQGRVDHGEVPHPDMKWGRFVEYDLDAAQPSRLMPVSRPYGENKAGVVVGVITNFTAKHPEGMDRVWIGSDPTRAMGALAEAECRRIIAALELARELKLPVEWIPISAGAKIAMDSGTENLDWTARVLDSIVGFTQEGGEINIIVAGVNVGAQSYWNAEATMLMHTRGVLIMTPDGSMVLTGKKALDFSGGVSAEDERGIGGFERIMGRNGQAQYFAANLGEAYAVLLEHYRFTYCKRGEFGPRRFASADPGERSILSYAYPSTDAEPFATIGEIFDAETNAGRKKPFSIRPVMRSVIDQDGGHMERFRELGGGGESAVVWDAHVGGWPVCVMGIESKPLTRRGRIPIDGPDLWTGGTLFPQSSRKVARALNAASGNRPVVVLANLSGFDGSPESMRQLQLEYGAEIGRAVVNFDGLIVFVVVGRYHGGAYVVFSKALNSGLRALALEGTFASVIGGAPAAAVVFPRDVRARTQKDPRVVALQSELEAADPARQPLLREQLSALIEEVTLEKRGEVAREFDAVHSVERAVEVGSLDRVISADQLRSAIIHEIEEAQPQDGPQDPERNPKQPGDRALFRRPRREP